MKIENLKVGMEFKNWNYLCEALEVQPKPSGKARKPQENEFKKYFDWTKQGQRITITEIYNEVQEREDGRKKSKPRKSKPNEYSIKGEYTEIYITYKDEIKTILIDTEDLDRVLMYRWNVSGHHVMICSRKETTYLHRYIMGLINTHSKNRKDILIVHHVNENPLDNRKCNLQIMTQEEHIRLHKTKGVEC